MGDRRTTLASRISSGRIGSFEAMAFVVGLVIGAGIFRTPSLVAANVPSVAAALSAWVLGGLISIVGALCYAELASAYPDRSGDVAFLERAFGRRVAFLYAWSRMTVIQTGSIALQAFLVGDYASAVLPLGRWSSGVYAALVVVGLTLTNVFGFRLGKNIQTLLSGGIVVGLLVVLGLGAFAPAAPTTPVAAPSTSFGLAMVFVLLTYGGWSEAAYLSSELRRTGRSIARVLVTGLLAITVLYVAANWVFLRALGLAGTAGSDAVAVDLLGRVLGAKSAALIGIVVVLAALASVNAAILTGGRSTWALGREVEGLAALGTWRGRAHAPVNALLAQGGVALLLVVFGTATRDGFATMVEYTAPVFWFFLFLVGVALLRLRAIDGRTPRPFLVPLYPLTPIVFCGASLYMLQASLLHTRGGALIGACVLLAGLPLLRLVRASHAPTPRFSGS